MLAHCRRHDGLTEPDGARQGPGRDLLLLEVRRDVDVRGGKKVGELALAHETIVEDHAGGDSSGPSALLEHEPIRFAVTLPHVRMRRAEHDVRDVRVTLEDRRKGVNDVLDPLVRREESEREDDALSLHAESLLAPWRRW